MKIDPKGIFEQLSYSTVLIEVGNNDRIDGSGTGFIFRTVTDQGNVDCIVTNMHVVRGHSFGTIRFHLSDDQGKLTDTNYEIRLRDFESGWIPHPDPQVDLCALPIRMVENILQKQNKRIFYKCITDDDILKDGVILAECDTVEEVYMIGYPNGIFDKHHNYPVFRRGITASHPGIDYNNKKQCLIDCACYPGSSGSPVFIVRSGSHRDKMTGDINIGSFFYHFLGILSSGPVIFNSGRIEIRDIPTAAVPVPTISTMMNLGYVEKSSLVVQLMDRILQFGQLSRKKHQ